MAKEGPDRSPRPPLVGPTRNVRAPPKPTSPRRSTKQPEATPSRSPDPEVVAKGEQAQEHFQAIFGDNLKAARLKAGLKQSEVAALTGLTQQYLSLIEAGQQNVTLRTMALLAEVVDHDLLDLLKKILGMPSKG